MRGAGERVTVKLRFAPGEAARRVQESVWHPLEQVTPVYAPGATGTAEVPAPTAWLHQLDAAWADPKRRRRGTDLLEAPDETVRRYTAPPGRE